MQKPDNWLVWAILSTVLCCLPLGIVAIIKACKVDTLWAEGKHEEAIAAAKEAKTWTLAGVGITVGFFVLYILIVCIAAVAAM